LHYEEENTKVHFLKFVSSVKMEERKHQN